MENYIQKLSFSTKAGLPSAQKDIRLAQLALTGVVLVLPPKRIKTVCQDLQWNNVSPLERKTKSAQQPGSPVEMFITVLHGENRADLFNTHCKVQILLDGIKHCCGCEEEDEIELADENGQVKNLLQNKHRCATELLVEREIYVLLGVTGGERPSEKIYTPLLKGENIINSKFLAKLEAWQDDKAPSPRIKARRTIKNPTWIFRLLKVYGTILLRVTEQDPSSLLQSKPGNYDSTAES